MAPVAIEDYAKDKFEVDLWGSLFTVARITKDSEDEIDEKLGEITRRAKALDLEKHANQIKVFGERMDVWLKPVGGGKKKASAIITEKWDAGDLTLLQAENWWAGVSEEIRRPI